MAEGRISILQDWSRRLDEILALGEVLLQHPGLVGDREGQKVGGASPTAASPSEGAWADWWALWLRRDQAFQQLQAAVQADTQNGLAPPGSGPVADVPMRHNAHGTDRAHNHEGAFSLDEAQQLDALAELRAKAEQAVVQNQALEQLLCKRMGDVQQALAHLRQVETFQHTYKQSRPRPASLLVDRRG